MQHIEKCGRDGLVYIDIWNREQRRIRMERINAASLALMANTANVHVWHYREMPSKEYRDFEVATAGDVLACAAGLIAAQDAAAQAAFAKGEDA